MGRAGALLILPSEARMAEPVVLYGGQAVVEGVMMRGPRRVAVAVRTADGDIALRVRESRPWTARYRLLRLPVVRGAATIVESLVLGLDALWYAAVKAGDAEEEDVGHGPLLAMAAVAAIAAAAFFALLPTWVAGWLEPLTGSAWLLNLGEGGVRIGLLVGYLAVLSRLPDMRRVYRYHGAEHKAVAALEAGCPLVVEAVRPFPIRHPRCGTSFLLFVAFVGVLVYGLLGWPNLLLRAVVRLLFFPVVAGVAYEVLRASARAQGWLFRAVTAPGLALQRLTTAEPDDDQLEVALVALRACQEEESEEESALRHAGSHA